MLQQTTSGNLARTPGWKSLKENFYLELKTSKYTVHPHYSILRQAVSDLILCTLATSSGKTNIPKAIRLLNVPYNDVEILVVYRGQFMKWI